MSRAIDTDEEPADISQTIARFTMVAMLFFLAGAVWARSAYRVRKLEEEVFKAKSDASWARVYVDRQLEKERAGAAR